MAARLAALAVFAAGLSAVQTCYLPFSLERCYLALGADADGQCNALTQRWSNELGQVSEHARGGGAVSTI